MKLIFLLFGTASFALLSGARAATPAQLFLQYLHGGENVEIEKLCLPNDDLWMLRGAKNSRALAEIEAVKGPPGRAEVLWETIDNSVCIIETRDAKIDATFNLEQAYMMQRRVILKFIYAVITQDSDALQRLTTNVENVKFGRFKVPSQNDLDQCLETIARLPSIRTSKPAADKISKTVTYRVPLGAAGFGLRLLKRDGQWCVDTSSAVEVPLEFLL